MKWLYRQFSKPTGARGWLAGHIMAARPSNRRRNAWTVGHLDIAEGHRLLEIGFGPGLAIQRIITSIRVGSVVGVDHSQLMVDMASSRNRQAIADWRVRLIKGELVDVDSS